MTWDHPNLDTMRARHAELKDQILRTPTVAAVSDRLTGVLGCRSLHLKLELFQHTGTFKARGALSVISALSPAERANGITAVSAGNHAIAAAWAARRAGISAKVIMISTANPLRVAKARAEGAEIVIKDGAAAAFDEADRLVRDEGRTLVHPFEGPNTTLGAAGVGLELIDDLPALDAVIVSVGGGGLISGVASAIKATAPGCRVYGVEPDGAASMTASLAAGKPVKMDRIETVADSLAPPYSLPYGFGLCQKHVDRVVTVSDDAICAALALCQEELKLAVEPAGAAVLAGALGPLRSDLTDKRVGLVICGANIDAEGYIALLKRGIPGIRSLLARPPVHSKV